MSVMQIFFILLTVQIFACGVLAADFPLMKNGIPASCIVLDENAGIVEKRAAEELASFLAKIAGGKAPEITNTPAKDLYPVYLKNVSDKQIKDDGFRIKADEKGLAISANIPRGVLYGAYEILKQYGGIRWLIPGDDGEFFTIRPTISVPEQDKLHNPSSRVRTMFFESCNINSPLVDTKDWMVRNNMYVSLYSSRFRWEEIKELFRERGGVVFDGLHAFSPLLFGALGHERTPAEQMEFAEKLYETHPGVSPLIQGERMKLLPRMHRFQPCTTNPKTIELMLESLLLWIEKWGDEAIMVIGNDDGTSWCQCEECQKIDPPEEKKISSVSTRNWTLVNTLVTRALDKYPHAQLYGWAYQNFHMPPAGIVPDKRVGVMLAFNNRCTRHTLDDPACPSNSRFLKYFKDWQNLGLGNSSFTWEQMNVGFRWYMPLEQIYTRDIKLFQELDVDGMMMPIAPPDGVYTPGLTASLTPYQWRSAWQTIYLVAQLLWDADRGIDEMLEEANSLYYGKAWDSGMKQFRELLIKSAAETPGCFGYLNMTPIGRCLDQPGVHDELLGYLARAEAAASDDPQVLARVRKDRELFGRTWEAERKKFLEHYSELTAYHKTAPIKIDGVFDEPDWENAEVMSRFMFARGIDGEKTFVKVTYEPDNLYFAITAMEPQPGLVRAEATEPDRALWRDSTLELFVNFPDLHGYLHVAFNKDGVVYEAMNKTGELADAGFRSGVEVSNLILDDRWQAEVRIPTVMLGGKCLPGTTWRINVGRHRVLTDETRSEVSSLAVNGAFHGIENFIPLSFATERRGVRDVREWRNPSFREVRKPEQIGRVPFTTWKEWEVGENGLLPAPGTWIAMTPKGKIELIQNLENELDYFLKLSEEGRIFQISGNQSHKAFRVRLRASGNGEFAVGVNRYMPLEPRGHRYLGNLASRTVAVDSSEWKDVEFVFEKPDTNEVFSVVLAHRSGDVLIDDVFAYPVAE